MGIIKMCKSVATIAGLIFATTATGVTNFKQITRYGFAIVAMPTIVVVVTRWISAMIVVRWFADRAPLC